MLPDFVVVDDGVLYVLVALLLLELLLYVEFVRYVRLYVEVDRGAV